MKVKRNLQSKNLHEYLRTVSHEVLNKLYTHPATCLAVFRELPELSQHFVMRLLFVERPVSQAVVSSWVSQTYNKESRLAVETLTSLSVWDQTTLQGGLPGWLLNRSYRDSLKTALLGGGSPWTTSQHLEPDPKQRDVPFLDNYAMERWECVLHYMVGSQQQEGISADAVRILLNANLMRRDECDNTSVITKSGFQFLLMDTSSQVWYFILQYLDTTSTRGLDLAECLNFLFQLSFSTLGKDYSTEGMSPGLLVFLQHLREFGLVYQRKRKAGRFYPTRLALNILTGLHKSHIDSHTSGYIVIETNYRVYAYTNSTLQVALVGLFTEMSYRFPNLAVAVITRESIRQALQSGIAADQIISFLRMHCHPKMLENDPVIPPTIIDQIRLWELERDRFRFSDGVLYNQFLSQQDFEVLRNYAQELEVLVWQNEHKRLMVVTQAGHDSVKKFWKRHRDSH